MGLNGPTTEDVRKIHAEVNQLVQQRFSLTTLAITVYGLVTAWLIPRQHPDAGATLDGFTILGSILLLMLLFLLYLTGHLLVGMIRVLTIYLAETGASGWEKDFASFRAGSDYWGYTKPHTIVFMILGLLATGFTPTLTVLYRLRWEPVVGYVALLCAFILYELLLWSMGFKRIFTRDQWVRARWHSLKVEAPEQTQLTTDDSGTGSK